MDVCIILHNMIVEIRHENFSVSEYLESGSGEQYAANDVFRRTSENENNPPPVVSLFKNAEQPINNVLLEADLATRMAIRVGAVNENIRNTAEHFSLKSDLMEHLWHRRSNRRQHRNINNHDGADEE
jgi:hypothetical protein